MKWIIAVLIILGMRSLILHTTHTIANDNIKGDTHYYNEINGMDISSLIQSLPYYKAVGKTDDAKAIDIYYKIIKQMDYDTFECGMIEQYNCGTKTINDAWSSHKGICTHYAYAFSQLCDKNGIQSTVEFTTDHALNTVKVDGKWIYVDVTLGDVTSGKLSGYNIIPVEQTETISRYDGK